MSVEKRIHELEAQIASLPVGYISRKMINGKERFYRQWREGKKTRSQYIKAEELEQVRAQIQERKSLEAERKELLREQELVRVAERNRSGAIHGKDVRYEITAQGGFVAEEKLTWRESPRWYLKWDDTVVGEIGSSWRVHFLAPEYNKALAEYTHGSSEWSSEEFRRFLSERIVSPDRRDIEQILRRLGLNEYDTLAIGIATRGINAKDHLWIAETPDEHFQDVASEVFQSVFGAKKDLEGDSVDTPEGFNIKRYGVYEDGYGIYKHRISPLTTDVESEVAVWNLSQLLKVPCCRCSRVDEDTVFSRFEYDFNREYIVHFRRLMRAQRGSDEFQNLIGVRPRYLADLVRMIALDFITRQDDRHLSNLAVCIGDSGEERFYPLYDNGRSLFYEDTEETVQKACGDIRRFATTFGASGSYYDYVTEISAMGITFGKLMDLEVSDRAIQDALESAGIAGYRLAGGQAWIRASIDYLKLLDSAR